MKITLAAVISSIFLFAAVSSAIAAEKGIEDMSREEMIKTAMSAAPDKISKEATVMVPGPDGKLTMAKQGTNEFTCIPDISGQETPDPFCGDKAAMQWMNDLVSKKERPSNTEPGIAYMAKGGWHWEKDGKILSGPEPDAKRMKEPPHWMVFWPFDTEETSLPAEPGRFGAYVMYEGTPYAHLMVYQDPSKMEK